jgi:hypothetical protein
LRTFEPRIIARLEYCRIRRRGDIVLDPIITRQAVLMHQTVNVAASGAAETTRAHPLIDQRRTAMPARRLASHTR